MLGLLVLIVEATTKSGHEPTSLFSLFAELERDLISLRTKEALAAKKQQGKTLGKPKGTIQKSKFDADLERIKDLLKLGLSVRKIAPFLATTTISHSTHVHQQTPTP